MYDVIIIGGGPAGLTAAIYAKRAGYSALLLEGGTPGGQAATTPDIENWPGSKQVSGPDFAMNLYEQAQSLGTDVRFERVAALADQGTYKTVATGGAPTRARRSSSPMASAAESWRYLGRSGWLAGGQLLRHLRRQFLPGQGHGGGGRRQHRPGGRPVPGQHLPQRIPDPPADAFKAERHLIDALAAAPNIHVLLSTRYWRSRGSRPCPPCWWRVRRVSVPCLWRGCSPPWAWLRTTRFSPRPWSWTSRAIL